MSFCLLFLAVVSFSCKKSKLEYEPDFRKSYKEWMDFKNLHGNSYEYTAVGSSWVGISWQTVITVKNGVVMKRHYTLTVPADWQGQIPPEELEWTEDGSSIGTHDGGSPAMTLDEVYQKASDDWLKKRDHTTTYFETKNNGIISTCGYRDDYCADDCFVGIVITSVNPVP